MSQSHASVSDRAEPPLESGPNQDTTVIALHIRTHAYAWKAKEVFEPVVERSDHGLFGRGVKTGAVKRDSSTHAFACRAAYLKVGPSRVVTSGVGSHYAK